MPTYEYACSDCKRRFEVVQSFSDEPLTVCEVCGGTLKRVFHPVGIVLKGSGFYSTDNRSSKSLTAGGKSDDKGDKGSEKKSTADTGSSPTPGSSGGGSSDAGSKGSSGSKGSTGSKGSGSKGSDAAAS